MEQVPTLESLAGEVVVSAVECEAGVLVTFASGLVLQVRGAEMIAVTSPA